MSIADALNIAPHDISTVTMSESEVVPVGSDSDNIDTDYKSARANQYELMEMGKASLNTAIRIAAESENPRAIEVLSGLLKNVSEINRQLITLNKDKVDAKNQPSKSNQTQITPSIGTQQNVFVGSNSDLNRMISERIKINTAS